MVEHQRYFPLEDKKTGKLASHFVITADQKINPEILQNNLAVLSARLTDGVFLYNQDLKIPLETFIQKLKTVTFHKELGSIYDKLSRIEANALLLNETLHVAKDEDLKRASHLCKADLASDMVHEFPELQGIIGMYYAKHQGESELIATAMKEHWQPISEKGALPETDLGRILSLADKLDNILSYYGVGIKPTSSKDPYALRRQTLGIIKILIDAKWSLSLDQLFSKKLKNPPLEQEVISFFTARLRPLLEEMGFEKDEIEACLSDQVGFNPLQIVAKVKALHHFRKGSTDFSSLVEVFRRAKGQIGGRARHSLEINLFTTPEEKNLYDCLTRLDPKIQKHLSHQEYEPLFSLLTELQKPMAHLFDQVKILDPDEKIKTNRIALLQKVFDLFQEVIDLDKLQVKA
jgi:glycyl-tRNA synthetase